MPAAAAPEEPFTSAAAAGLVADKGRALRSSASLVVPALREHPARA